MSFSLKQSSIMASKRSADEVKAQFIKAFPDDTGRLYHDLWRRLLTAYLTWDMFESLYMESEEQVELLNRTAGLFFNRLRTFLYQETFLSLSRITDPPSSAGEENASLRQLVNRLEPHISAEENETISTATDRAEEATENITKYRHKMLAHKDLNATLGEAEVPSIVVEDVESALDVVGETLNEIRGLFQNVPTHFEAPSHVGGVDSLVRALEDHELLEQTCQEFWKKEDPKVSLIDLCQKR